MLMFVIVHVALRKKKILLRLPMYYTWKYANLSRTGIIAGHGKNWKLLKRFTLRTLKDFGVGKSSLEEKIKEELDFFVAEINSKGGEPFDPKMLVENAVSNMICSMVFGER